MPLPPRQPPLSFPLPYTPSPINVPVAYNPYPNPQNQPNILSPPPPCPSSSSSSNSQSIEYHSLPSISPDSSYSSPSHNLTVFYFNARSVLAKLDNLSSICTLYSPDLVCIIESWLSSDIPDTKIFIHNYTVHCRDRNRHGSGILIYIKSTFLTTVLPSPTNIELLLLSIKGRNFNLTIGNFYRLPNCPCDLDILLDFLSNLPPQQLLNLALLSDFNINYLQESPPTQKLNLFANSFNLSQLVKETTHVSCSDSSSLIDLIFVPSNLTSNSCHFTTCLNF